MRYSSESSAGCAVCVVSDFRDLEEVGGVFWLADWRVVLLVDLGVPFNWGLTSGVRVAEAFACVLDFFVRIVLS